ncbi:NarK family nitrate/nitrite MFS transporter [Paenibacillus turpanensis]|uniref:NarK family nitrate/nitrite MFS transporter n=1 Tax=Paenibacillus turpanensis TaxID=2689078 RepID=UPI00140B9347|nr:NarK family nitrate/nitrite MFS transporter [Paenibacillus turpanensis]
MQTTIKQRIPKQPEKVPATIQQWDPENEAFWESTGKRIATRNLWISIPALLLAFCVWQLWSVVAVNLNSVGFQFSPDQLFTLAALPGLTGATLRIFYTFLVPIVGGRNFTILSTASLLIPAIGIGFAVQNPETPYYVMVILAALCGFGGGNFASSSANISFFYPKKVKGTALGMNAGLGNLGVSVVQFLTPVIVTFGVFGSLGGSAQILTKNGAEQQQWLQNAAFIWVVPIILTCIVAYFGMNNLASAKSSFREQAVVFKNKHTWIMSWLYTMCFGSFIGYSAAFPLLIKTSFEGINPLTYAFIGPLLGALIRPVGGWLSDKLGGAKVTFWDIIVMLGATVGVIYFLSVHHFTGFLLMFLLLFITTGIANGSTFRMIPVIFKQKEAAAVIGFTSAIGAYGAFFIPKAFGLAIDKTGAPDAALYAFLAYYVTCLVITYWFYFRKNAEVKC